MAGNSKGDRKMTSKNIVSFRNNLEFVIIGCIALVGVLVSIFLNCQLNNKMFSCTTSSPLLSILKDYSTLEVIGGFVGLLLAAYAILFGLVPSINKRMLKSYLFEQINFVFLISLFTSILLFIANIMMHFFDAGFYLHFFIFLQVFLSLLFIQLMVMTGFVLYFLFKAVRKDLINSI